MSPGGHSWRHEPLEGGERLSGALAKPHSIAANDDAAEEREERDFDWRAAIMRLRDKWMSLGPVPQWMILAVIAFPAVYLFGGDDQAKKPAVVTAEMTSDGYVRFKFGDADTRSMSDDEMKRRLSQESSPQTLSTKPVLQEAVSSGDVIGRSRSTAASKAAAQQSKPAVMPKGRPLSWYGPGGTIATHSEKKSEAEPLRIGTRFKAHLEVGVSSSSNTDVVAKLDTDIELAGKTIFRKGDVILGRATSARDDTRIMLDFHALYSGTRTIGFRGYAIGDGVPGLVAERRGGAARGDAGPSAVDKLADFTKDVVGEAVSSGGGTLRAADRHFVQETLDRGRYRQEARPAAVLSLPAGTKFEVIVSR